MLPEIVMMIVLLTGGLFIIGRPIYKYVNAVVPKKRNSLAEARERLEQARLDVEAAELHKKAEKLYEKLYEETLQDEEQDQQEKRK